MNYYSNNKPSQIKQDDIYVAFENYLRKEFFELNENNKLEKISTKFKRILIKFLKPKLMRLNKT